MTSSVDHSGKPFSSSPSQAPLMSSSSSPSRTGGKEKTEMLVGSGLSKQATTPALPNLSQRFKPLKDTSGPSSTAFDMHQHYQFVDGFPLSFLSLLPLFFSLFIYSLYLPRYGAICYQFQAVMYPKNIPFSWYFFFPCYFIFYLYLSDNIILGQFAAELQNYLSEFISLCSSFFLFFPSPFLFFSFLFFSFLFFSFLFFSFLFFSFLFFSFLFFSFLFFSFLFFSFLFFSFLFFSFLFFSFLSFPFLSFPFSKVFFKKINQKILGKLITRTLLPLIFFSVILGFVASCNRFPFPSPFFPLLLPPPLLTSFPSWTLKI